MQKKDLLQRDRFIYNIEKYIELFLQDDSKNAVIAIDGKWGCGKTFVVEKLIDNIDVLKYRNEVEQSRRYFVSYYNCWKYDYYEEPLIAIINNLFDTFEKFNKEFRDNEHLKAEKVNKFFSKAGAVVNGVVQNFIGINLKDVVDDTAELANKYDKNADLQTIITKLQCEIKRITSTIPLVIIVDELDRCIPAYAIKTLERLHHIFNGLENVIVLVSIDKTQLEHSVESIFGNKVDTDSYLKKFIDITLYLDEGNLIDEWIEEYEEQLFKDFRTHDQWYNYNAYYPEMRSFVRFLLDTINIREREKVLKKAVLIYKLLKNENGAVLNECICSFLILYLIASEKYTIKGDVNWIGTFIKSGMRREFERELDLYNKYSEKEIALLVGKDKFINFLAIQIDVAFDRSEGSNSLRNLKYYVSGICLALFAFVTGVDKDPSVVVCQNSSTAYRIIELCEFLK